MRACNVIHEGSGMRYHRQGEREEGSLAVNCPSTRGGGRYEYANAEEEAGSLSFPSSHLGQKKTHKNTGGGEGDDDVVEMGEKKSMCRKRKEEEEDEEEARGGGEQHHLIFLASGYPGADFDKKN